MLSSPPPYSQTLYFESRIRQNYVGTGAAGAEAPKQPPSLLHLLILSLFFSDRLSFGRRCFFSFCHHNSVSSAVAASSSLRQVVASVAPQDLAIAVAAARRSNRRHCYRRSSQFSISVGLPMLSSMFFLFSLFSV
ncbi:hypothetical protein LXL04_026727 [Taraxacum kok-saghyz]